MSRIASNARRSDWLAGFATLLAIVACYGTLILVSALSVLGITLAIHEGAWAGTVSLFALIAAGAVLLGYRRHRTLGPLILACVGAALILWVMFGRYDRIVELAGFAALVCAAAWNWYAMRKNHRQESRDGRT